MFLLASPELPLGPPLAVYPPFVAQLHHCHTLGICDISLVTDCGSAGPGKQPVKSALFFGVLSPCAAQHVTKATVDVAMLGIHACCLAPLPGYVHVSYYLSCRSTVTDKSPVSSAVVFRSICRYAFRFLGAGAAAATRLRDGGAAGGAGDHDGRGWLKLVNCHCSAYTYYSGHSTTLAGQGRTVSAGARPVAAQARGPAWPRRPGSPRSHSVRVRTT